MSEKIIDSSFEIVETTPFGDPSNGESYRVKLSHDCPVDGKLTLDTGFGRCCVEEKKIICDDCGKSVIVRKDLKHPEIIYLAGLL